MTAPTAPFARSYAELQTYLDLTPCECGSADVAWRERQTRHDGWKAVTFAGRCRDCRRRRAFDFAMPALLWPLPTGRYSELDRPSALLDPGEWLRVADFHGMPALEAIAAGAVPERGTPEQVRDRNVGLARAAGALEEVLLFVPAGAEAVPAAAFTSEFGRQVLAAEPERFTRPALEALRDAFRGQAGSFDLDEGPGSSGPGRARSAREARLWIDLRRCACGAEEFDAEERVEPPPAARPELPDAVLRVEGRCPLCGVRRAYAFAVPFEPAREPSPYGLHYEGDGPSTLLDPARLLAFGLQCGQLADRLLAEEPPATWNDPERWVAGLELFAAAAAGFEEVLLFVPPGADRVPAHRVADGALGRTMLRRDPDTFRRDRLEAALDERLRAIEAFAAAHPEPRDVR